MNLSQDELDSMFSDALSCINKKKDDTPIKKKTINQCSSCDEYSLFTDTQNGHIVCLKCGNIESDQLIDESAEWSFGADEAASGGKDPSRCGMPTSEFFPNSSNSTTISGGKNNGLMKRLQMQMAMDYVERSRYHLFVSIGKMCDNLPSSILDTTKRLYLDMAKLKLSRGNIRKGLIACCIFYACKSHNSPRSVKEIACMCDIEPTIVNNAHKLFQDIMKDHYIAEYFKDSTEVNDLTSRFCSYLGLERKINAKITNRIHFMNKIIEEESLLIGKTPSAVTAACIFYVIEDLQLGISKKELSQKLSVSIVTINKILDILIQNKKLFIYNK